MKRMSQKEYLKFHKDMCEKAYRITKKKNTDYAGGGDNALKNFMAVEYLGICESERGILVRLTDKLSRLAHIIDRPPVVVEESLEDTCLDMVNYAILLLAQRKDKRNGGKAAGSFDPTRPRV